MKGIYDRFFRANKLKKRYLLDYIEARERFLRLKFRMFMIVEFLARGFLWQVGLAGSERLAVDQKYSDSSNMRYGIYISPSQNSSHYINKTLVLPSVLLSITSH